MSHGKERPGPSHPKTKVFLQGGTTFLYHLVYSAVPTTESGAFYTSPPDFLPH